MIPESVKKIYSYYDTFRPFSDAEAWFIFRIAAFAEAIGWTLLIIGIICKQIPFTGNEVPVAIGGRIHGMFFVAYIIATLATGPSLRWSFLRTLIAGLLSVPPYGSLLFEKIVSIERAMISARMFATITRYSIVMRHNLDIVKP